VTDNLIVAGNYAHMLYGLGTDGKQKWAFDSKTGNFIGTPMVYKDTVVAPTSNNSFYAVSAVDGKELWSYETGNTLWATPVTDGNIVYAPALDHNLYALNLADGKLVWKKDLGSGLPSGAILTQDGSTLYQTTMNGDVAAIKTADGSIQWKVNTGNRLWATPVLHDDTLYVGDEGGKVTAVSIKDQKIVWQKDAGSPILGGGALLPDGVVFTTEGTNRGNDNNGKAIAYAFADGKELWQQTVNGKLYTTPVVAGNTVAVGIMGGVNADANKLIQTYDASGKASWSFMTPK
jgi:eukaryotic-like serine/threonine-protein kinase